MLMLHFTPTLAADDGWVRVLVPVVIFGFIIIGSIVKAVREQAESNKKRQSKTPTTTGEGTRNLDDLAERRRRQLQELAERRRRQQSAPAPGSSAPGRTASETTPRRPASAGSPRPAAPPVTAQSQSRNSSRRLDEELARRRAEAQQRQQQEQEARQAAMQRRRQEQLAAARRAEETRRRESMERQVARRAHADARMQVVSGEPGHDQTVHRHVPDVAAKAPMTHADLARVLPRMDHKMLQQAIILKEILDRPVALRDPLDTL
jgi:hypothetical protein